MIDNEVRSYLQAHNASGEEVEFSDEASLLEAGVIDSAAMVDLITFLEQNFSIAVDEDDMIPENFDSVAAITTYVESKRAAAR